MSGIPLWEHQGFIQVGTAQIYLVFVMVNVTLHQAIGGHMKNIIKKKIEELKKNL